MISDSTREKLRAARLGKKDSESTRLKKSANLERARAIQSQTIAEPDSAFGQYIRNARLAKKITQKDLSSLVGIAENHLRVIERGHKSPPRDPIVIRLAWALQIDGHELLALAQAERPPKRTTSEETRQKMRLARLSKKDSPETRAKKRSSKLRRSLMKSTLKYTRTKCGFCEELGANGLKTAIYYKDEDLTLALCPDCFRDWQAKPDGAVLVSEGKRQEKSA